MASFSYLIQDISELDLVAKQISELSQMHKIFLFDGKMGSGKTTLIKKVVHLLGVFESSSPTFSIINSYLPDTFVSVSISFDNNLRKITIES